MIGTWGPKLAALAAEIADEVKVGGSANPDMARTMRGYLANDAVGVVMGAVTVVDEDRDQAREAARRAAALYLPVVAPLDPTVPVEPKLLTRIRQAVAQGEPGAAAQLISDSLLERFAIAGKPADVIRQAEALFDAGARRVEFGTPHGLSAGEGLRLLGERVVPALEGVSRMRQKTRPDWGKQRADKVGCGSGLYQIVVTPDTLSFHPG
ncbi:MAG: LLM class flavin-dependent oxidoreductase [Anaerolineae bacterium]|nr:LLM class flavin-dependent oxidoreductase [Anaerolineae bacterium]